MERDRKRPAQPISDVITGVRQPHKMALSPKKKRPRYIKWLVAAVVIILLLIVGGLYWRANNDKNRTLSEQGVSFKYPKAYSLEDKTTNRNAIAVLKQTDPISDITVAKEQAADTGALIAKRNVLDILELNASKSLPQAYKNFQKDGDQRVRIDGFDAADYSWHYLGKDGFTIVYAHLFIIPRGHDAYYVTIESVNQKEVTSVAAQVRTSLKLP